MKQSEYVKSIYKYVKTFLSKTNILEKYNEFHETGSYIQEYRKDFPVWVFWWQGFDNAPELVKLCINSMKRNLPDNAVIHFLDKDNYADYVNMPEIAIKRFREGVLDIVHFSDVLRVELLKNYGGLWIDSTIFVSRKLESGYFDKIFFTQNYGELDIDNDVARGRWGTYLLGAHKNTSLFLFLSDAWKCYLEKHSNILDYYLLDYFIAVAYDNISCIRKLIDECKPNNLHIHDIQDLYSAGEYDEEWYNILTNDTQLFKMTYKNVRPRFTQSGKLTLYGWMYKNYYDNSLIGGETVKIYTITHKEFMPPKDPLYAPLHVGHIKYSDGTLPANTPDYGYLGDDTGDNISAKNNLYSELTGLYWIWKNAPDDDYVGLVHYRRFFADENGLILTENGVRELLKESDIIIGEHIEYEVSYEEKFAEYHHVEDLLKTGEVIKRLYPDYYDTFLSVIQSRKQYVFNMMITSRELLNSYSKWLFDICSELENVIDVSGYDSYHARIYGFLAEELLFVWIKHNNLRYKELPVIYSQEKAETIEFKKNLKQIIREDGFEKAYEFFLKTFKERPDLTLEDSDFTQELRIILYILEYSNRYKGELDKRYFDDYVKKYSNVDKILTEAVSNNFSDFNECEVDRFRTGLLGISKKELDIICERNTYFSEKRKLIDKFMSDLFNDEFLSIQVLYYDSSMAESLKNSVESLKNQSVNFFNIEVVDAVGDAAIIIQEDSVTIHHYETVDFESVCGLKNAAISKTKHNRVCQIEAGTIFDMTDIEMIANSKPLFKTEGFETVFSKGITSSSVMIFDKRSINIVGGYNEKLKAAEDFELALRIFDYDYNEPGIGMINLYEADMPVYQETYETYAYCLSKYTTKLKELCLFDGLFTKYFEQAKSYGIEEYFVNNAEKFMSKSEDYQLIDKETRPVLILMGENICRGILDRFAYALAKGFEQIGQNVILHNINDGGINAIYELTKRDYKAVVGFQTEIFSKQLPDKNLAGNLFKCKKIQWTFDHPLCFSYHLMVPINDLYVFSQDGNYAAYAKEYFPYVKDAWHISPAGDIYEQTEGKFLETVDNHPGIVSELWKNKKYNITFVGAYNNYRDRLSAIKALNKDERRIACKLINVLKHSPDLTIEEGLKKVLMLLGKEDVSDRDFVILMHHMIEVSRLMPFYYREKVITTILDSGIDIDVFSDLWKHAPFAKNPHLHIHEDVSYKEGLKVMQESRISLNVMSWHKDGMTERIANAMLNASVCLTDKTRYISNNFKNKEECFIYDLNLLEEIGDIIRDILSKKDSELEIICQRAYENAVNNHTWVARARQVAEIMNR